MTAIRFLPIVLSALLFLTACTGGRMLLYNFSDIKDYKRFPKRDLPASADPFVFAVGDTAGFKEKDVRVAHESRHNHLDSLLMASKTVAFLVIQRDSILHESYYHKYGPQSLVASFSMAKSYTSAMIGAAVADGLIKSIEDPVTDYIPELKKRDMDNCKIRHLLQMTAGIHHVENYFNPFAGVARLYYGRALRKQVLKLNQDYRGGHYFHYQSIATQLLGEVLVRVTGKSLTAYLREKIWDHIGTEHPASWSIDQRKNSREKAFSSINATARDFAKFGRLFLHKGNWNGQQLLPEAWVRASTKVDAQDGSVWYYQYQWWLPSKDGDFYAAGHLGQFIYVNPMKDLLIVRLGKNRGGVDWRRALMEIAHQL